MKLQIIIDKNKQIENYKTNVSIGKNTKNSNINVEKIIKDKLEKILPNENFDIQAKKAIDLFNNGDVKEFAILSARSNKYSTFLKEFATTSNDVKLLRYIDSVVFISKNKENIIGDLYNTIIFFGKLTFEKKQTWRPNDFSIYFELERIEFNHFDVNIKKHEKIYELINFQFEKIENNNEAKSLSSTNDDFIIFLEQNKVDKIINIFEGETSLLFKENFTFIKYFYDFLQSSEKQKVKFWKIDNENFWAFVDKENEIIFKSKEIFVQNENDTNIKIDAKINNYKEINKLQWIEKLIETNQNNINIKNNTKKEIEQKINDKYEILKELEQEKDNEYLKLHDVKNKNSLFKKNNEKDKNNLKKDNENKILICEKNIKKFEENILKQKNDIEKCKSDIKNVNDEIEKFKEDNKKLLGTFIFFKKSKETIIEFNFELKFNKTNENQKELVEFDTYDLNTLSLNFENYINKQDWVLSDFNVGLLEKVKRNFWNFKDLQNGFYKNPYLAASLEKPLPVKIDEIDIEHLSNKNKLNEMQDEAVKQAIASDDVMYLQGPPGTGKTETISSVAEYYIKRDGKILITSSTHAAIDNFLTRLDTKIMQNNPNVFIYKYRYGKKDIEYNDENMFKRFIKSIDNIIFPTNKNDYEKIVRNLEQIENENWEDFSFYSSYISQKANNIINNYKNIQDIQDISQYYKIDIQSDEFDSEENFIDMIRGQIDQKTHLEKTKKSTKEKYSKWENFLSQIQDIESIPFDYLKSINKLKEWFNKNNKENKGFKIYKDFKNKITNEESEELNQFLDLIIDKNLINVFGITTTSRKEIDINNIRKSLFFDIPIDLVILDEVSKSTTAEIISNSILASKILLSGDYRQLPPVNDIDEKLFEKFSKSEQFYKMEDEDQNNTFEKVNTFKKLNELFEKSLFKNQVNEIQKLKQNSWSKYSYSFLNEQYRFNKSIMKVVNTFYDGEELLRLSENNKRSEFGRLIFARNKPLRNSFNIIDTSKISEDYLEFLKKENVDTNIIKTIEQNDKIAFDQKQSFFNNKKTYDSRINEFNAFVIAKIIKESLEKNCFELKDIGIITITRSQAFVIEDMLKKLKVIDDTKRKIRINTVDNFQGNEMPIIFVDTVSASGQYRENRIEYGRERNNDFYKKVERLNVAVSRAQEKLIIVGAIVEFLSEKISSTIFETNGNEKTIHPFKEFENIAKSEEGLLKW